MASQLRQVLTYFEEGQETVSLNQMAQKLGIERPLLEGMIDYWVKRGKLREVGATACQTCGSTSHCPFVMTLPRRYELVRGHSDETGETCTTAGCSCTPPL